MRPAGRVTAVFPRAEGMALSSSRATAPETQRIRAADDTARPIIVLA